MWSFSVRRRLIDAQLSEEPWWIARFAKGGRSLTPEESEEASRLFRAARSDLRALEALAADPEQEHDVIGFHAQQAVEKALKDVMSGLA
jgi:HEPN domain-containing protein